MNQALEIVRFRVAPHQAAAFVAQRPGVDAALSPFRGFMGSELAEGPGGVWTLLVRWASAADAQAAQAVTLSSEGLPALAAWTALAQEFLSFETAEVHRASTEASNLAVALRFASEGLGQVDMQAFDELIHPDIVVTTGLSPGAPIRGLAAYKQVFAGFADAWPARRFEIEDSFAAGDKVVVRFTATTVFSKDYYGVPATGVVAPLKEVHLYTLRDGQIVEIVVGAINLPFEFIMYPALKDAVLAGLEVAR